MISESLKYAYNREVLTANEGRVAGRGLRWGCEFPREKKSGHFENDFPSSVETCLGIEKRDFRTN